MWAVPFSAPCRSLACSVFSPGVGSGGISPGEHGVRGREVPFPSLGKPLKNVYMPNRM